MIDVTTEELFILVGFITIVAIIFGVAAFVADILDRHNQ